jgi:hypothetical protein
MSVKIKVNLEMAKFNPGSVFKRPGDVVTSPELTRKDKVDILQRWAYDERELAVAEEENMTAIDSDSSNLLTEIINCLLELGVNEQENPPPTKQG